jgi:hypothetical protein
MPNRVVTDATFQAREPADDLRARIGDQLPAAPAAEYATPDVCDEGAMHPHQCGRHRPWLDIVRGGTGFLSEHGGKQSRVSGDDLALASL